MKVVIRANSIVTGSGVQSVAPYPWLARRALSASLSVIATASFPSADSRNVVETTPRMVELDRYGLVVMRSMRGMGSVRSWSTASAPASRSSAAEALPLATATDWASPVFAASTSRGESAM